jgi:hypothetical protein
MIMPGVQKPHWVAKASRKARCSGCRRPPSESPDVWHNGAVAGFGQRQAGEPSSPSMMTEQAPQVP